MTRFVSNHSEGSYDFTNVGLSFAFYISTFTNRATQKEIVSVINKN